MALYSVLVSLHALGNAGRSQGVSADNGQHHHLVFLLGSGKERVFFARAFIVTAALAGRPIRASS